MGCEPDDYWVDLGGSKWRYKSGTLLLEDPSWLGREAPLNPKHTADSVLIVALSLNEKRIILFTYLIMGE